MFQDTIRFGSFSRFSLIKNIDNWYIGMDVGRVVGVVFIVHKKAFGTVDHNILCEKV